MGRYTFFVAAVAVTICAACRSSDVGTDTATGTADDLPVTSATATAEVPANPTTTPPPLPPPTTNSEPPADLGNHDDVVIPAANDPATLVRYLTGDGRDAVTLVASTGLLRTHSIDSCADTAAALDAAGPPGDFLNAITQIPDEPTRDIFAGLYAATGPQLGNCEVGDQRTADEFDWQWDLAARRLDELGIEYT